MSCRDQVYDISDVRTVDDLLKELQSKSRISQRDLKPAKVLYRGKVLDRTDLLKNRGVAENDSLIVVTDNYRLKGIEVMALFLEMLGNDDSFDRLQSKWQQQGTGTYLRAMWSELQNVDKSEVSRGLRTSMDILYHRLRSTWEHPHFRLALSDPTQIEAYRKVVARHLSKKIFKSMSPDAQRTLQDPEAWKNQVLRFSSSLFRCGDIIMDSMLQIVLDVFNGSSVAAQTSALSSVYKQPESFQDGSPNSQSSIYDQTMEDPSIANQMLFELSESEDGM